MAEKITVGLASHGYVSHSTGSLVYAYAQVECVRYLYRILCMDESQKDSE